VLIGCKQLVGGLDVIKELIEGGELADALGQAQGSAALPLNERLEKLINQKVSHLSTASLTCLLQMGAMIRSQ